MQNRLRRQTASVLLVFVMLIGVGVNTVLSAQPFAPGTPAVGAPDGGVAFPGDLPGIIIVADPQDRGDQAPILAPQLRMAQAATANITVTYLPSAAAWPSDARTAFEAAISIWEGLIASPVEITVDAEWKDMGDPMILGGASTRNAWRDFTGAPQAGTWYVAALANKLAGQDLDTPNSDIYAQFNSTFSWYFGTSGNPPLGTYDFMTVVLHELTHGLGMTGSLKVVNGTGGWGFVHTSSGPYYPFAYDRYAVNGSGSALIDAGLYPNPSAALAAQLTSNNVYFSGANARAANGGNSPKLYAPSPWQQGSSYSHLDESFNNSANTLMTYSIGPREVVHSPGTIVLGIFKDIGWSTSAPVVPTATAKPPTATPTRIPPFTVRNRNWLPNIDRGYVNPKPSTPVPGGSFSLNGKMTLLGAGVSGLPLELRYCSKDGSACATSATLSTNADGSYSFANLTGPASDKFYYVRYINNAGLAGALWYWFSEAVSSPPTGTTVTLPTYDVTDISLSMPTSGSVVDPPVSFQWGMRPYTPSEGYGLEMMSYPSGTPYWQSGSLGHTNNFTLTNMPSGFSLQTTYVWDVCALGPAGAEGCSYYGHYISFSSASLAPAAPERRVEMNALRPAPELDRAWAR